MKRIFNIISIWVGFVAFSQVGIATQTPKTSLHIAETNIVPQTQAQGVIFPHFSTDRRAEFDNIEVGMLIYNTTKKCIEMYLGYYNNQHNWTCIKGSDNLNKKGHSLAIIPSGFEGDYLDGLTFDKTNTVKWTITNNGKNDVIHLDFRDAITLYNRTAQIEVKPNQNTDISIPAGGTVTLVYTLIGTPTAGDLKAVFNKIELYAEQKVHIWKYSSKQTYTRKMSFEKSNCESGYTGTSYRFTKDYTGMGVSDISQEDADNKALNNAKEKAKSDAANFKVLGQEAANLYGDCVSNSYGKRGNQGALCFYKINDSPNPRQPWRIYSTTACRCDEVFPNTPHMYGWAINWNEYSEPDNPLAVYPYTCAEEKQEEEERKQREEEEKNNWSIPPAGDSLWLVPNISKER